MADLIPRFGINYGLAALSRACLAAAGGRTPSASGLESLFGKRELIWAGSGRQALILILRALKLKPGSKIAIPLFSSGSVTTSLTAAGYQSVFVDVDPQTLTMCPRALAQVADRVSAIVAVHLFGNLAAMDRIMDAAGSLSVIEDAAQAPYALWGQRLVGTIGAASFYSFATSKAIPAAGGGLAATSDPQLAASLRSLTAELNPRSGLYGLKSSLQQMAKTALFSRTLYGPVGNRMRSGTEDRGILLAEVDRNAISPSSAAAVLSLSKAYRERMRIQRQNSLALINRLRDIEDVVLPREPATPANTQYGYTLFPVLLADGAERNAVRAALLEKGIDTSIVHHNSVETAIQHGYHGGCPVSENVCRRIITLPHYAGLSSRDLDRISSAFHSAVALHRITAQPKFPKQMEAFAS